MKQEDYIQLLEAELGRFYAAIIRAKNHAVKTLSDQRSSSESVMFSRATLALTTAPELNLCSLIVGVIKEENGYEYVTVSNPDYKDGGVRVLIQTGQRQ